MIIEFTKMGLLENCEYWMTGTWNLKAGVQLHMLDNRLNGEAMVILVGAHHIPEVPVHTTQSKIMDTILSHSISKILTDYLSNSSIWKK